MTASNPTDMPERIYVLDKTVTVNGRTMEERWGGMCNT
jgi:hypothetical protein